jgi:hypothetical protein
MHNVIERLHIGIEALLADSQYFASAPAKRHSPAFI